MMSLFKPSLLLALLWFTGCNQSSKTNGSDAHIESAELAPKTIEVNGVNLHYVEKGEGTPVVFVHGGFSDYRTWRYQMEDFSKEYRAISYSRRYFYPNDVPIDSTSDFSMVNIDDLTSFIKSLRAGPVHLVGHSSGGWVALQATIHQPELMKTLTLGEPAVVELLEGDPLAGSIMNEFEKGLIPVLEAFTRNEDEKGTRLFLELVTGDPKHFENFSPEGREIAMDNYTEFKAEFLVQNPVHERPPLTCTDIQKISVPTLLVVGDKTPRWLTYLSDKLEACLQNSEQVTLPDTSHGLEYENPEAFNEAVLEFLGRH